MSDKSTSEALDLNNGRLSTQSSISMAPPSTPTFSASSGFNHSFMPYQQSSQFVHPPSIFSNVHNYDGNYVPMHPPTMSYMNLLNSPPSFHQQFQGSNASGLFQAPSGATNITSDSGCNKRAATDEVVETSVPPRMKKRALATKKRKICIDNDIDIDIDNANNSPTRWWTSAHDEVLIPFLANMAKSGLKPDKNFKSHAYRMAALEVNKQFGTRFITKSVANHMKTVRGWYQDMRAARNISGAGWDEKTQTIIIDPDSFDRWNEDKNKSRLKEYINKPLKHYENLAAICGDDQARGNFSKASMEKFGGRESINLAEPDDDDDDDSIPMTQKSPQVTNLDEEDNQSQNNSNAKTPIHDNSKQQTSHKGKGKKSKIENDIMQQIVDEVKHFSSSMKDVNMHWSEKLSKAIFGYKDTYPIEILELFYDSIFENESKARHFIGKSEFGQRTLLDNFKKSQEGNS